MKNLSVFLLLDLYFAGIPNPVISNDKIKDKYIVLLKENNELSGHFSKLNSMFSDNPEFGLFRVDSVYEAFSGYSVTMSEELAREVSGFPEVDIVEQDQLMHAQKVTQQDAPWGLARITTREKLIQKNDASTYQYYHSSNGGSGVSVYVLDTGVNLKHKDFEGRAIFGENFSESGNEDLNGHGTHCAGAIGGKHFGVAKNVTIIALKVLNDNGSGSNSKILQAIDYLNKIAKKKNTESIIASMSLGGAYSMVMNKAVSKTVESGVIFVVAAGNSARSACQFSPASAEGVISVGATDINDKRAYFSNYGSCVSTFAPGKDIISTWIGGENANKTISGTSMAAPHVAGLAAIILSESKKKLTPKQVMEKILESATKDMLSDIKSDSPNLLIHNEVD